MTHEQLQHALQAIDAEYNKQVLDKQLEIERSREQAEQELQELNADLLKLADQYMAKKDAVFADFDKAMQEATEKAVLALNEQKPDPYEPFRTLDVATLQKRYTKAALIEIAKALGTATQPQNLVYS